MKLLYFFDINFSKEKPQKEAKQHSTGSKQKHERFFYHRI